MDVGAILIALGVGSILTAAVNALFNRRKLGADTASILTKAAAELVQPLRERIAELEDEVAQLRDSVRTAVAELGANQAELDRCHDINRAKDALIAELTRNN